MYLVFILLSVLIIPILFLFLGLQVISLGDFVKSGFEQEFRIIFDISRYREYPDFLLPVLLLAALTVVSFLMNTVFSSRARAQRKIKTLTPQEKKDSSRLAKRHEAKKGTQRLEFNSKGQNLQNRTFRGRIDILFDPIKRLWNSLITALRVSDIYKFNTLHEWKIGEETTCRRGGPPILTSKRRIWVDAADTHSLVVGTTRSGKTFSIVNILIQSLRMSGESMIIMDVKGELYKAHGQSLIDDGYDVKVVDFINPKKSVRWNPLGIIIRKYREAYREYQRQMSLPENKEIVDEISQDRVLIAQFKRQITSTDGDHDDLLKQIKILEKEIESLKAMLPKPNYSEAQELISDIAMRLCHEEDARDPFWSSSATTILEGYINFLLEQKIEDESGKMVFLPDEMINMRSVKMLHDQGKTWIDPEKYDNCSSILEYFITKKRKQTDQSYMKLIEFVRSPDNTRGSISAVFGDKIKYFLANEDILNMTSVSEFDLKQLGERKTTVFIGIHDEKGTYHELPSILISQTYEELIKLARNETDNSRLKVPVYVVWDEFANGSRWDNIVNALTAGLSRGVRFCLVIQDFAQLNTKYGKEKANTIRSNCQNLYYLLAGEYSTLKDVSDVCGSKIIWNHNRQEKETVPVLSTDALSKLSMGEVVIKRQRMNPILTRLRSFDRYCFRLPETPDLTDRRLPEAPFFSIHDEFYKIKPRSEGNTITEKIREDTAEKENSVSGGQPVEEEACGMKEGQEVGLVES
ncbi:MAG: type IV secretory system conjugative DNA transfer family protein [Erysipelotrichaceae bacterium]|nr:type IV secretory system conjugative DNA transfer family protein [Erysipelotrichaceae bacterium]